jgi:hypothetical protein
MEIKTDFLRKRNKGILRGRGVTLPLTVTFGLLAFIALAGEQGAAHARPGEQSEKRGVLPAYHAYDPSAPELMLRLPAGLREWTPQDIEAELRARLGFEMRRRELNVNYYRIGYTIAYPLPLADSPKMDDLPVGIRGITYPWYTWLSWALEERWRVFHAAWRRFGDRDVGARLQLELAALAGWSQSCETPGSASLGTAHIAGCLAQALAAREEWDEEFFAKARSAAETILERDVWPWFEREWPAGRELSARDLQNIRVIILARSAELARVVGSPRAAPLEARMREALRAWFRYRLGQPPYNEGSAYDGFLMDSLTSWLSGEPDREALLAEGRDAFASQAAQWIHLTLPGRVDIQAPLGDVEPQMPFWQTALFRLALWYGWRDCAWLAHRLPAAGMPAAFLGQAIERGSSLKGGAAPASRPSEHPHALALRTGWDASDILAAVGLTRAETGHMHTDAGQVILGWQGRFWITDPGYQQYRPGAEREFSIGPEAHNLPLIAGKAPTKRAPRLVSVSGLSDGGQRAVIDLSACYEGLPEGASVEREIRLLPRAAPVVVVRDRLRGVGDGAEVQTVWLSGSNLAWAFREGWGRLSDGERALWIGVFPGSIAAAGLDRHEGSRGPLALHEKTRFPGGSGDRYWVFAGDSADAWAPPSEKFRSIIQSWEKGVVGRRDGSRSPMDRRAGSPHNRAGSH